MREILVNHGLAELGRWVASTKHATVAHLIPVCAFGINYALPKEWHRRSNVVYAFLVDGLVCYLGETTSGMAPRFDGYRYGNTLVTDTDNRVKLAITQALKDGCDVTIWAGQPIAHLTLQNGQPLNIPVSKPVEELLIDLLKPNLNVKNIGKSSN